MAVIDFVNDAALGELRVAETAFTPVLSSSSENKGDETVPLIAIRPVAVIL